MFGQKHVKRILLITVSVTVLWVIASALFLWPPLAHYEGDSANACISKLRQIDGAKQQWALQTGHTNGTVVTQADLENYVKAAAFQCPSGGSYTIGAIGEDPTCSFASIAPPPGVKERIGAFGWRWKTWPSSSQSHRLPL